MNNLFPYLVCVGVRVDPVLLYVILNAQNPHQQKRGGLGYGLHASVKDVSELTSLSRNVNIRINQSSPLCLIKGEGLDSYEIDFNGKTIATVKTFQAEEWAMKKLTSGRYVSEILQKHTGNNLVGIIGGTRCSLFDAGNACSFCQMTGGMENLNRTTEEIIEALEIITGYRKNYVLTFTTPLMTLPVFENVCESLAKIKKVFPLLPLALESQPASALIIDKIKNAGVDTWMVPLDCYSPQAQRSHIPGKIELINEVYWYVLPYAVSIFGVGNVISNIIVGLEDEYYTNKAIEKMIAMDVIPDPIPIRPPAYMRYQTDPFIFARVQDFLQKEMLRTGLNLRMSEIKSGCAKCGGCAAGQSLNMLRKKIKV